MKLLVLTKAGVAMRDQISDAVVERSMVLRRLTDNQCRTLAPLLQALLGENSD